MYNNIIKEIPATDLQKIKKEIENGIDSAKANNDIKTYNELASAYHLVNIRIAQQYLQPSKIIFGQQGKKADKKKAFVRKSVKEAAMQTDLPFLAAVFCLILLYRAYRIMFG